MTKRLQVLVDDNEMDSIRRLARERGMTTADWVREALREAVTRAGGRDARMKLDAIRAAARYSFPIGDIEEILTEIERGYAGT